MPSLPTTTPRSLFQSQGRSQSPGYQASDTLQTSSIYSFILSQEANPLPTERMHFIQRHSEQFQSQARSQSSGDKRRQVGRKLAHSVSISGEKPILWRRSS